MILVVGGGPAGIFGAIAAKTAFSGAEVRVLEKGAGLLRKVAISGGGRCNVTNACQVPRDLAAFYPRGGKALIGPLNQFGPAETVRWFADHGVSVKAEPDGRVFPTTDQSSTIVDCLLETARKMGVKIQTRTAVQNVEAFPGGDGFAVQLTDGQTLSCKRLLLATGGQSGSSKSEGSAASGLDLAASLGHTIQAPVPSLFTFKIKDVLLEGLAGVAVPDAEVRVLGPGLPNKGLSQQGPVLVTHWGLSGPAVLRLSAWGARTLAELDYTCSVRVNWIPSVSRPDLDARLRQQTDEHGKRLLGARAPVDVPRRLWQAILVKVGVDPELKWAGLSKKNRNALVEALCATELKSTGRSVNKDEFVTCGGVDLGQVDLRTMASRACPGLYLAGEVLDIDGLTGGFNFQAAWTTGWLAGQAMADQGERTSSK